MNEATDAVNQWIIADELRASAWQRLALDADLWGESEREAELILGMFLRLAYEIGAGRAELPGLPQGAVDWVAIAEALMRGARQTTEIMD